MILMSSLVGAHRAGIPRESGDDPFAEAEARLATAYSPRERG